MRQRSKAAQRRLRIGLDARECCDPWTGMGRYGLSVISALAERNRHDFVIWIGPQGDVPDELERADVKVVRSAAGAYEPLEHLRLPREIQREGVDVFHALTYSLPLSSPATTSMTLFDVIPLLFPGNYSVKAQLYWRHVLPRTVRRARRIVTLSEQSRHDILSHFAVMPDKIVVLPAGVDKFFAPDPNFETTLARLGVKTPYVLAHGNQRPHKNIATLLESFRLLHASRPDLSLVVSGGGRTSDNDATRGIHFTGEIDDTTLRALYSGAAVYTLPSLYEGAGLTPLEAMACAAPCVLANTGALPELYSTAAVFAAPDALSLASAIAGLLDQPSLAKRLRSSGSRLVESRNWSGSAAALEAVLEEVATT